MTLAPAQGVPGLRSALRRARRAGAEVVKVPSTGEVRVTYGDTRLLINARRKDATRELVALVAQAEAEAVARPRPAPTQLPKWRSSMPDAAPAPGPDPANPKPWENRSAKEWDRIRARVRAIPANGAGWRPYSSGTIAKELGLTSTRVAGWVSNALIRKEVEVRRRDPAKDRSHITHLRFVAERVIAPEEPALHHRPRTVEEAKAEEAALTPVGMLPTPTLAVYAQARKLAQGNDMLHVELSEEETAEVLTEAVRLFHWVRASAKGLTVLVSGLMASEAAHHLSTAILGTHWHS